MGEAVEPMAPWAAALLVMDCQPSIVGRLPNGGKDLLARAAEPIAVVRAHGVTVGHVRVAFGDDDFAAVPAANKSFAPLAASHPPFFHKNAKDYRFIVLSDACADPETEVHDRLIGKILPRQAEVLTVAELPGFLAAT